jgi:hypothetical protein
VIRKPAPLGRTAFGLAGCALLLPLLTRTLNAHFGPADYPLLGAMLLVGIGCWIASIVFAALAVTSDGHTNRRGGAWAMVTALAAGPGVILLWVSVLFVG